jgi:hypothetical protein
MTDDEERQNGQKKNSSNETRPFKGTYPSQRPPALQIELSEETGNQEEYGSHPQRVMVVEQAHEHKKRVDAYDRNDYH